MSETSGCPGAASFLRAYCRPVNPLAFIARRLLGAIPTLAVIVALSFLLLIGVLLVKPTGILGKPRLEKV